MTVRIPLRALLLILYSAAMLGGAFGISYAVFEWRDDKPTGVDLSAIEQKIDALEQQATAGPTQAELDAQLCEAALEALSVAVARPQGERISFVPASLGEAVDRYCK